MILTAWQGISKFMGCTNSTRRTLAVIHVAQAAESLVGLVQWVTAKVFSGLIPTESNGSSTKISDQSVIASAVRHCASLPENSGSNGTRESLATCLSIPVGRVDSLTPSYTPYSPNPSQGG